MRRWVEGNIGVWVFVVLWVIGAESLEGSEDDSLPSRRGEIWQ